MKSFKFFFIIAIILVALFLFRPAVVSFFVGARSFFLSFVDRSFDYQSFQKLKLENESLKQELNLVQKSEIQNDSGLLSAQVYSQYPFNGRGLFIINLGERDGIKEGLPVLAAPGILLGRIHGVKKTQSDVITIFDPTWRGSVTIGREGVKALLRGGLTPTLELIPVDAKIMTGDEAVNISPEAPIGLSLGALGGIQKSANNLWLKADLKTAYQPESLDKVFVVREFP